MPSSGKGEPFTERERAARHFNVDVSAVTPDMIQQLPPRGTGLETGKARGTEEPDIDMSAMGGITNMKVTEKCNRVVDVWLDIAKDFSVLKGLIYADKEYKDMDNVFGDLILTEDYGFSKEILSKEDREISKYHRDRIKGLLGNKFGATRAAEEAITWAGRTFADRVVTCECGDGK